jgi:oligogalacturonide transport system permease protein
VEQNTAISLKKSRTHKRSKTLKKYTGLLYIAPWLLGFLGFQLYPLISSFYYSFTNLSLGGTPKFVGLDNYIRMFTVDPEFWKSLSVTIIYVFTSVPAKLVFALLIAMILNSKLKFINAFRTIYYIPSILGGSVAVSVLWRFLFMKEGTINKLLSVFSLPALDWIGSPNLALFTIDILTVWQFGSSMVLFLAGLKQIPAELYEAGIMDGASKVRMFFTITIPMLTPIVFFNVIMQLVGAFQEFTSAFVITGGGPMQSTYLYGMKLYLEAFRYFKMGYASALSWVLFLIILLFTAIVFKSSRKWVYYDDGGEF